MSGRRELATAAGLCLLGAALVLLALSRPWLTLHLGAAPPLPSRRVTVAGTHLVPGAQALGLLGLAGVAALPATRRIGRLLVGLVLTAAGGGVVVAVVRALLDPVAAAVRTGQVEPAAARSGLGGWPWLALLGGALIAAAGLLAALRGRGWSELSARYDAPTASRPAKEPSLWEALDRGEDPTSAGSADGG